MHVVLKKHMIVEQNKADCIAYRKCYYTQQLKQNRRKMQEKEKDEKDINE